MSGNTTNILLVEDDESHAEFIRRAFELRDGNVALTFVRSLREARATLEHFTPDLMIADLLLPDGAGVELLAGGEGALSFPVIVMTSHGDEQRAVEAMKAGALDYIVKTDGILMDLPHIAERALREWRHILERRRAEGALQKSEEHFRSLIENGLDIITVLDVSGIIHYESPSIERVLGYRPDELVGTSAFDLVHADDRQKVVHAVARAFATPGRTHTVIYRSLHKDGSWRTLESRGRTHHPDDGARRSVMNTRDITETIRVEEAKEKLEAQLRHSQKLETIGTLAGGIAHDFNNILSPLLGYTELALASLPPSSRARSDLEHVIKAAKRATNLVQQILAVSCRVEQQRQLVEIQLIVKEALKLLRATLPSTVSIEQTIDCDCGSVLADATQVHQVMMNLCTNAAHAMSEHGGVLEVSLETTEVDGELARALPNLTEGRHVQLTVSDTGHGMEASTVERIFEPFFTTKSVGEGSGLGLSVVQGIVASHGGDITVVSELEAGTTFTVYLPCAEHEPTYESPGDESDYRGKGRILFVDDDEEIALMGKEMLEWLGYEVTVTTNSPRALEVFETQPDAFDVVITDQTMPQMTGVHLARELMNVRADIPIILITGFSKTITSENIKELGIRDYLLKPFAARDLGKALQRVLT